MNLSKNFTFNELTNTSHTSLLEKNRLEAKEYLDNLVALANDILEPLRDILKEPIYINSGFRGDALNAKVGGSKTSQHSYGEAVDIRVKSKTAEQLFNIIKLNLPLFDNKIGQVILEKVGSSEWVHISLKTDRYKAILKSRYGSDKTVFLFTDDGKNYKVV